LLAGRHAPTPQSAAAINALRQRAARIEVRRVDVANRQEVEAVLREIEKELPPLAGVLHAAGVLDDGVFLEQTWERVERVLAPKAAGAWNLHELTAGKPLDFFLLFSSVASLVGSPGQSGYTAANAFLDALAHYRAARGLAALSVNWGPWSESGMAARVEQAGRRRVLPGLRPMNARQCLAALETAMAGNWTQVAIADTDWSGWTPAPRLLSAVVKRASSVESSPDGKGILDLIDAAAPTHRRQLLLDYLRHQAAWLLGIGAAGPPIDEHQPLLRLGMDSLMAVEFRNLLASALQRSLSATFVFDYPTICAQADFLTNHAAHQGDSYLEGDAILEELETLSEAEAEELLKEELKRS